MIHTTIQPLGLIGANACLIESDGINVLIDPGGMPVEWDNPLPKIDLLVCTHGHFDHIWGADAFREQTGAPVLIHPDDADALTDPSVNASRLFGRPRRFKPADRLIVDGERITLDDHHWLEVISTPGHTQGGVCLLLVRDDQPAVLFSGDTLFAGSIGRLDIGGNPAAMKRSLKRLMTLPDHVQVHPGHGPSTTIGAERLGNPYLRLDTGSHSDFTW